MIIRNTAAFGEEVRKRRKKLGYTQKYISDCTGLSVTFISDLENGKKTIELGKALLLANMLGMDLALKERDERQ
ncbi:MAG: helix-turn-helix domain-containing protein [Lachnospiraceae bacterium]|nr:helix-turn-helix domain-containing protein [Lachnospiraceae bacterium]